MDDMNEIYFAGGNPITHHFYEILGGHVDRCMRAFRVDVLPVFGMMLVASFVMKPSLAISVIGTFTHMWRLGASEVLDAIKKFRRRILREVVC